VFQQTAWSDVDVQVAETDLPEGSTEPAESRIERARRVVDSRLLSQSEFQQLEARQIAKQLSADKRTGRTAKRSRQDVEDAPRQEFVPFISRFFNLRDASPKWGHGIILGGRELDSTIVFFSPISSVSRLYSYTHTDFSRCGGKKIIVNVHGFSVLRQNFNRGDITFLTKYSGGAVKKG